VAGTIEEMTVGVGTATEIVDWIGRVVAHLPRIWGHQRSAGGREQESGKGRGATESSGLPVAMYPTKAHINPKLYENYK
jgi:hypothetical protein